MPSLCGGTVSGMRRCQVPAVQIRVNTAILQDNKLQSSMLAALNRWCS